jgi:Gluconate 2-dehydrogenase subunit 3
MSGTFRVDRRTTLKWILAASAALPALPRVSIGAAPGPAARPPDAAAGYGTDPDLMHIYKAGEAWPLTFGDRERRTVAALCDLVIPADDRSPAASAVGVVDFIDEWISAPYAPMQDDRRTLLAGLSWLDRESERRFGRAFADLEAREMTAICDDICHLPEAKPELEEAARFFARFRDLAVGGFYTTPAGMRDIQYVGNVALPRFDGPPPEVLRRVGLADGEELTPA